MVLDLAGSSTKRLYVIHCNYIVVSIDTGRYTLPSIKKGMKLNTKVDLPEPVAVKGRLLIKCKVQLLFKFLCYFSCTFVALSFDSLVCGIHTIIKSCSVESEERRRSIFANVREICRHRKR